jgi:hypothetical protein
MYVNGNPKTKSQLKKWIKEGVNPSVFQPGPFGGNEPDNGRVVLEGPHYPEPHKWYATGILENGRLVKVS